MTGPALKTLMTERQWEQDWPQLSQGLSQDVPANWGAALSLRVSEKDDLEGLEQVARLLKGDRTATPTIRHLRTVLADLALWNTWAENHLTYPPTLDAFASALVKGLGNEDKTIRAQTQRVAFCYPELSWGALNAAPHWKNQLPDTLKTQWWPVALAPIQEASVPVTPAVSVPARSAVAQPLPARPAPPARSASRDEPVHAPRSYEADARWPREKLLPLVRAAAGHPTALVSQSLDEALRQHFNTTTQVTPALTRTWNEEVLLPALMSLKANELRELMAYWPNSFRCEIKNPVDLVNSPKFWARLRDAEPDAQRTLIQNVFPVVLQTHNWTTEDRLRMLRVMMPYAKNKLELFEQRMNLWLRLGGNLNEQGVLAKDRREEMNEDAFSPSSARQSALEWIREENVPVWNQWLDKHTGVPEVAPASMPAAPVSSMRRHQRPR